MSRIVRKPYPLEIAIKEAGFGIDMYCVTLADHLEDNLSNGVVNQTVKVEIEQGLAALNEAEACLSRAWQLINGY